MLNMIAKLAPVITSMTKDADGNPRPVSKHFRGLVQLPLAVGLILVLVGLFAPGVAEERRSALYEVGFALLVGGPVVYHGRKRLTKGDAIKAPAPAPSEPVPAPEAKPAPADDAEAAKQIENL